MKIIIRYNNENHQIDLSDESKISDLMNLIETTIGIPFDNQKLICKGKTLSDRNALLTKYNITENTKLLLVGSADPPEPISANPIPTTLLDFAMRSPKISRDEYLTAPPHSIIIKKGVPEKAMEGGNFPIDFLPNEPFVVRDKVGDIATLSFRSDDIVINSDNNSDRLFYHEIISFGIQAIPGYEQKYIAIGFHIKGKKIWVYFVPKQYRGIIEYILQQRRA